MSAHDAISALKELGLSNYEARVFVALQQLGTATAQEVSQVSDVPRSQVYGTADDLANRGFLEVVESSPKRYRAVSLAAARKQLQSRIERQQDRAFENLESLQHEHADHAGESDVSTLHGQHGIDDRLTELVRRAQERVVLVVGDGSLVSEAAEAVLRERAETGVSVVVVTEDPEIETRFEDDPVQVVVSGRERTGGFTGRTLLVDDATVLLSVLTDGDDPEPFEETALWTADTRIGHILAQFVHAGMQSGFGNEYDD